MYSFTPRHTSLINLDSKTIKEFRLQFHIPHAHSRTLAHATYHNTTRNTQHATRNTQHATRNTQHPTRNTQHAITHHTSHITHHTSHITHHTSHITHHTSHITHNTSHITHHTSHITHHTSHPEYLRYHFNACIPIPKKTHSSNIGGDELHNDANEFFSKVQSIVEEYPFQGFLFIFFSFSLIFFYFFPSSPSMMNVLLRFKVW
jgi:hypothetical protein